MQGSKEGSLSSQHTAGKFLPGTGCIQGFQVQAGQGKERHRLWVLDLRLALHFRRPQE